MPFFIKVSGRPFGPFDENQLSEMKSRGRINSSTEISSDRINWQTASTLDFLFPTSRQQAFDPTLQTQTQTSATDFGAQNSLPETQERKIWFYSFDGNNGFGPVAPSAIVQMLQSGQLNGQSYVWKEGDTALFLQAIPEFSQYFGGAKTNNADRSATQDWSGDSGGILSPLERSLDWLMFLKVLYLIGFIFFGLTFALAVLFVVSRAVASDSASTLLATIIFVLLGGGYYYLMFRPFWSLWKYHEILQRAVVSRQEAELVEANQHLFQHWKDSGIFMIVNLSLFALSVIVVVICAGTGVGLMERFYGL